MEPFGGDLSCVLWRIFWNFRELIGDFIQLNGSFKKSFEGFRSCSIVWNSRKSRMMKQFKCYDRMWINSPEIQSCSTVIPWNLRNSSQNYMNFEAKIKKPSNSLSKPHESSILTVSSILLLLIFQFHQKSKFITKFEINQPIIQHFRQKHSLSITPQHFQSPQTLHVLKINGISILKCM
jgi:hypothetical protein